MAQQVEGYLQGSPSDFGMTAKELSNQFIQDNLKDNTSFRFLLRYGGVEGLMKMLKTDSQNGLDNRNMYDMEQRVKNFGDNKAVIKKGKSYLDFIYENFEDQMLRLLCLIAIVNLLLDLWIEGQGCFDDIVILVAVFIIILVLAGNSYVKDQKLKKMDIIIENRNVNVKRGGKLVSINIDQLVVGDIMIIEKGEKLPVDGIVIESSDLMVDESSITGETKLIKKNVPITSDLNEKVNPFLISGSAIIEGIGKMLVLAVGENSQLRIFKNQEQKFDKILLQEKLNILAEQIGEYGVKIAFTTFVAMIFHLLYNAIFNQYPLFSLNTLKEIFNSLIFSITIIVVSVPEGLPLIVTTALAYSIFKIKDQNNLLKEYSACEAMGCVNNICCDKTGILIENKYNVTHLFIEDKNLNKLDPQSIKNNTLELLCEGICLNSMVPLQVYDQNICEYRIDQTEYALLEMCYKFGYDYKKIRQKMDGRIITKFPEQKIKMTQILDQKGDRNYYKIYTKGAPEMLLNKCSHYINGEGKIEVITNDYKQKLNNIIKDYGQQQIRSILLLFKDALIQDNLQKIEEFNIQQEQIDNSRSYTIIGLIGLQEELKDGIRKTVEQCNQGGVTVRLITEDSIDIAIAISKKVGILPQNYEYHKDSFTVMEGYTFNQMIEGLIVNDQDTPQIKNLKNFQKIIKDLRVLVKSSPEDKQCLIAGLKQVENVVAMIGNGVNDVQLLKKADVGFAMEISGTNVAKEAASIILLDDNFASIITSMKWGRNIFDCIRKYLVFQITINIVTVLIASLGEIFLKQSPLNCIQMLWISLIMDTLASLALATEPPTNYILLTNKPFKKIDNIITSEMSKTIICQAVFQIFILLIILFYGEFMFDIQSSRNIIIKEQYNPIYLQHYTIFFNIFIFLSIFNQFNARKYKKIELNIFQGIFNNYLFICVILITIIVQIIIVQFGGKTFKVAPLDFTQHIVCILIGMFSLEVGYLIKFIPNQYFQSLQIFKQQIPIEEDQETIPLIKDYQESQIKA